MGCDKSDEGEDVRLRKYAATIEWFLDHPEAAKGNVIIERFMAWVRDELKDGEEEEADRAHAGPAGTGS